MGQLWKIRRKLQSGITKTHLLLNEGRFLQSKFGPKMRVRRLDYTRRVALLRAGPGVEFYEDVFAEVDQLRRGMAFFDIGANAGLFTLIASARVGSNGLVLAFEPSMAVFKDLVDNLVENGATNVVPFNIALGSADELVSFDAGKDTHSGIASVSREGTARCAQFRFDGLFDAIDAMCGDRAMVMKMDIEGAEVHALRSMTRLLGSPNLEKVVVEVDDALLQRFGTSERDLYEIFAHQGFDAKFGLGHGDHYNEIFTRPSKPARQP